MWVTSSHHSIKQALLSSFRKVLNVSLGRTILKSNQNLTFKVICVAFAPLLLPLCVCVRAHINIVTWSKQNRYLVM